MFRSLNSARNQAVVSLACLGALLSFNAFGDTSFSGIGRTATPQEVAAWDIDVRPDFKGLPAGQGSVAQGMVVWEGKCASCHGVFGESNQTFSPLVGGTTAQDIQSGHVQRLNDPAYPGRTTLMKASTLSTLWDYINRAMPWTEPKSLTTNEVYAVVAYLLNLGNIVPEDLVLSNSNMAQVQKLLPNRNGMTTDHGLWPGKLIGNGGKPDVKAVACMKDCNTDVAIKSSLPDFARNAHGNLAEQNRIVGAQHGVDTTLAPAATMAQARATADSSKPALPVVKTASAAAIALTKTYSCVACHGVDARIVGPSFKEIGKKYESRADAVTYLEGKIRAGGSGVWGDIPMPPQSLKGVEATAIAKWLIAGSPK
ncbi:c-type cytochrome [Rhodoferax sp. PAMC 29310]|uniref:c-type cytochrome n=1 Tax=Rhodoferax sp. PAMC 29310 TaxID=2822760 RepID=UPI001B339DEC|nr:c-type cytochrome [Rhodoferax sp. PAMC 29310]